MGNGVSELTAGDLGISVLGLRQVIRFSSQELTLCVALSLWTQCEKTLVSEYLLRERVCVLPQYSYSPVT